MRVGDGVGLSLEHTEFLLEPGGHHLPATLVVDNAGPIVDEFRLYVEGLDPGLSSLEPDVVRLFPHSQTTATLTVRAPDAALAGTYRFRVVATCSRDPSITASVDASLEIATVGGIELEAVPSRLRGRRRASSRLYVRNHRNTHSPLRLLVTDPEALLRFQLVPPELMLPPGASATVRLLVQLPRARLTGPGREHQFAAVLLEGDNLLAPPLAATSGQVVQLPLVAWLAGLAALAGRWALTALMLLLLVAVGIWYLGAPGEPMPQPLAEAPALTVPEPPPIAAAPPAAPAGALGLAAAASQSAPANAAGTGGAVGAAARAARTTAVRTPTPQVPVIARFGLAAPSGEPSPSVPLQWTVRGASAVSLEQNRPTGSDPLNAYDAIERRDYTLRASNAIGQQAQSLSVFVVRPPAIDDFSVDRSEITTGQNVYLLWRTARALRAFLDDTPLDAIEAGSVTLQPAETHTYTLRAENGAGQVEQSVTVSVSPPPTPTPTATPRPTPVVRR
jgi:hypothetical protein